MQNYDQRSNLSNKWLVLLAAIAAFSILIFSDFGKNRTVIYDCREAHWHPDYPLKIREECKKIMKEELEKKKQENIVRT